MSSTLKYISCPVSQLDLLEPIGVQTQVESFKDIEYLPTSAIQDGVPITFEIGKDERFTDLSELVIKTVVEIQGENGAALTGKQFTNAEAAGTLEKVGVINNLGHSLWEQIVLSINDTKVTESSNNYAYKAMLDCGSLCIYDCGSLCIFDDVINEVSSNSMASKLFTHGKSYLGCPLVLMLQNIFPKGTQSRTISINAQYQVLFRNPKNRLQILILVHQLCPLNSKDFLEIYKRATQRPHGYLFCCFTQSCPDETCYRTNVLPDEYPSIVYQL